VIVDGLLHLGTSHFGYELDLVAAVAQLATVGSDRALAVSAHPRGGDFPPANDLVLQAAQDSVGRILGLARVDPWEGRAAVTEVHRAVTAGARGVFLHPGEEHFRINDSRVRPIIEAAAELGVAVVVAAGTHLLSEPLQLAQAAQWVPQTPFVLTNGGQFNISGMAQFDAELALGNDNVLVQTTAMYRQDFLEGVVAKFGPERLMYASGAPVFNMGYERARVDAAHLSNADRDLVLAGNAERVFGP
jgi:predicted TIM-barrel fold metal-dependent hydrolase